MKVHPLKTYSNFKDLSGSQFQEAVEKEDIPTKPANIISSGESGPTEKSSITADSKPQIKQQTAKKLSKSAKKTAGSSTTSASKQDAKPKKSASDGVILRKKAAVIPEVEAQKQESRSSVTYESSSSEDESVSVTTGRLSLTLSHSSGKEGAIDVTAATVEKEEIQTDLTAVLKSPAVRMMPKPQFATTRQTGEKSEKN